MQPKLTIFGFFLEFSSGADLKNVWGLTIAIKEHTQFKSGLIELIRRQKIVKVAFCKNLVGFLRISGFSFSVVGASVRSAVLFRRDAKLVVESAVRTYFL